MDPELQKLLSLESNKQLTTINLVASENYTPKSILNVLSHELSNKYAEGLPSDRLYPGIEFVDKIEQRAVQLVKKAFSIDNSWFVNCQVLSGAPANLCLFQHILQLKDKILMLDYHHGGHMSHGTSDSLIGKLFEVHTYKLNEFGLLDYEAIEKAVLEVKPKLLIAGYSLYPRDIDYEKLSGICKASSVHLHADISHIAGFVPTGILNSPFPFADSVVCTTHKSLRGPRGALLFTRFEALAAVFPAVQAGPHMATIAAICEQFYQICFNPRFKEYAEAVVKNAQRLAFLLMKQDFAVQTGGTDTHMIILEVGDGAEAEKRLGAHGILVNACYSVAMQKTCIRIGLNAVTSLGKREDDMDILASLIVKGLKGESKDLAAGVQAFTAGFKLPE